MNQYCVCDKRAPFRKNVVWMQFFIYFISIQKNELLFFTNRENLQKNVDIQNNLDGQPNFQTRSLSNGLSN